MPSYQRQMQLASDPLAIELEELINPKIDRLNYSDWIEEKRFIGKKKFNRIDKRQRRLAIKHKQKGIN